MQRQISITRWTWTVCLVAIPLFTQAQQITPAAETTDPFPIDSVWFSARLNLSLRVLERDGNTFRAKIVAGNTVDRTVAGTVDGGRIAWLAKDVQAAKGGPGGDNTGTIRGDRIDVEYRSAVGNGTFTLLRSNALESHPRLSSDGENRSEHSRPTARGSELTTYPGPAGMKSAKDRLVRVNGQSVFVYETAVNFNRKFEENPKTELTPFCYFDFSGTVTVEVTAVGTPIRSVTVRPQSLKIRPAIDRAKNAVTFDLSRPAKLSIEFNGDVHRTLHIFASAPESDRPDPNDANVRYFGPGVHSVGNVQLADNQSAYIAGGAFVNGQLIAKNKSGVRIFGRGILNGSHRDRFRDAGCNLVLINCTDSTVDGIICLDPPGVSFVVNRCSNVNIRDLKYIGARANSDGISIQCCSGVTVSDCFVRGWDDNVVVKNYDGNSRKIRINDCILWTDLAQSMEVGFETTGDVMDDITFRNIDVVHNFHKPVMSIHNGDRASITNVRFENIRVEDARMGAGDGWNYLIDLWIGESHWTQDRQRGTISGVVFKNISVTGGHFPQSRIWGFDATHTVSNVTIENLVILGKRIKSAESGKFIMNNFIEQPRFR